jgi:hypothetical protein
MMRVRLVEKGGEYRAAAEHIRLVIELERRLVSTIVCPGPEAEEDV